MTYPTTTLRLDVSAAALRDVLAECSIQRDEFPSYVHNAIAGAQPWMPVVSCAGTRYVVIVANVTTSGAHAILAVLAAHENREGQ
jgi:hypothetical protein